VVAQCTFVRHSAFLWSAVQLTLYESGAVSGESKLVLSLDTVRPEVSAAAEGPARRPLSMVRPSWFSACTPYALKLDADTRRTNSIVSMTLSPRSCHTVNPTTRFMAIIQVNLR